MARLIFLCIVLNSFQTGSARQVATAPPPATAAADKAANIESFELIWRTIRNSHWDESLVGESWENYRTELQPKIEAASTNQEAREVMTELIQRLGQSHFAVIPRDSYDVIEGIPGGDWDVGLTVRLVDDQLVVTYVRPDSAAATAGVQPGWAIDRVRDRTADDLLQRFEQAGHGPQRKETIAGLAMDRITSGNKGEQLSVDFRDVNDQARQLKLEFEKPPGKISKFGNLPPIRVVDVTKTLPGNVGYYKFNAFLDPMRIMPAWRKAIRDENNRNGIIIDLRGNIGGLAGMTMGMTGEFVTKPSSLGTMTMKDNKLNFVANPRPNPITAPVAVLVDECSISSAEILAGGLKDLGLARIFGSRTAGLAYPSLIIKLPNGDGFQYAIADYQSAAGERLEKTGVIPDQEIKLTRNYLSQKGDPVLNQAQEWIARKNRD